MQAPLRPARFPDMPFRADPWLHVIAGCMSSGKTDELLRLLRRAEIARRRILLVRPEIDDRTPGEYAESRSKARFPSVLVSRSEPSGILALARERLRRRPAGGRTPGTPQRR